MTPLSVPRTGMAGTILPDEVFVFGGRNGSGIYQNITEKVYYPTGPWNPLAAMPTARAFASATKLPNGKILVIGGQNSIGHLSTVEEYDPVSNTWTSRPPMNTPRSRAKALTIAGMVHVFGGYNGLFALNTHEIYNPTTMVWSTANPMPMALMDMNGATMNYGGAETAHIMGGRTMFGNHASIVSNHWEYLPSTDTYLSRLNMPQGLANFGASAEDLILHAVYAFGGYTTSGAPTNAIYRYSRINNIWETLSTVLANPIAEFYGDGFWDRTTVCSYHILAIGGVNGSGLVQSAGTGYYMQSGPFAAQGMDLSTVVDQQGIQLNWQIQNGEPVDHFTIMHEHENGPREILTSSMPSNLQTEWAFLHENLAKGKHHYYVLAHLANGATRYTAESEIIISEEISEWELYPVPTQDVLNIALPGAQSGLVLQILDAQGRLLVESQLPGKSFHQIDLSNFAKGIYFARIQANGTMSTKRFSLD